MKAEFPQKNFPQIDFFFKHAKKKLSQLLILKEIWAVWKKYDFLFLLETLHIDKKTTAENLLKVTVWAAFSNVM